MAIDKKLIIDNSAFSDIITNFDKKVSDVEDTLSQISNIMNNIDGENDNWNSITARSVHEKYSKLEENFVQINSELKVFSLFLKETQSEYLKEEQREEKAVEEYSESLNIN